LRDTAYRSRVLLSDRLHFNPSEPDLRVFDLDRELPARERDELPGVLRIGLLKPRRDIPSAAVDDVRRAIALPDDLDRIPLIQQLEVAILDEAAAGRFRRRRCTSARGRTGSGSGRTTRSPNLLRLLSAILLCQVV
jgi:hypothetical protein